MYLHQNYIQHQPFICSICTHLIIITQSPPKGHRIKFHRLHQHGSLGEQSIANALKMKYQDMINGVHCIRTRHSYDFLMKASIKQLGGTKYVCCNEIDSGKSMVHIFISSFDRASCESGSLVPAIPFDHSLKCMSGFCFIIRLVRVRSETGIFVGHDLCTDLNQYTLK